jgi:hypothetical protein
MTSGHDGTIDLIRRIVKESILLINEGGHGGVIMSNNDAKNELNDVLISYVVSRQRSAPTIGKLLDFLKRLEISVSKLRDNMGGMTLGATYVSFVTKAKELVVERLRRFGAENIDAEKLEADVFNMIPLETIETVWNDRYKKYFPNPASGISQIFGADLSLRDVVTPAHLRKHSM